MVSQAGTSIRGMLEGKLKELDDALESVDESKAGERAADGEWCCKEVLSHLMGDEREDITAGFRKAVAEDTPLIPIVTGLPYYTPARQALSISQMRGAVRGRYDQLSEYLGGLTDEQLNRKARVPLFKETPLGEYPTLAQVAGALINIHLADHINQIRSVRGQMGA